MLSSLDRDRDRDRDTQTHRHTDTHTHNQTHTDRQTDTHTHTHKQAHTNTHPRVFALRAAGVQIMLWARRRDHANVAAALEEHGVDGDALLKLKAVHLVRMGVQASQHDRLLADIGEHKHTCVASL